MKVAVVGSQSMTVSDLKPYLPEDTTEIASGGGRGIAACAREYARTKGLKLTEFLPEYEKYGRTAPSRRNQKMIDYADVVIVFWDGVSQGTGHVIEQCIRQHKKLTVYMRGEEEDHELALKS